MSPSMIISDTDRSIRPPFFSSMGIVKVASCVPAAKSGYNCGDEDLTREDKLLLQSFPNPESDDCEHAEVDCELARSEGQICNVPYDLYDLPELKDVLYLETWNLCLTDDDRFHLAAYLPDMDQHDFFSTMEELLSGSAMFFGSPRRSFFHRLNGGFYSPEVSQARELLMVFQRRRYYHFLKSYHDDMVWKFTSMDKLQRSCHKSTSLQEKVHIWHNMRYKPLTVVDQNSYPFNRSLSVIGEGEAATFSPLKRAKLMDGAATTHCSAEHKGIVQRAKSMEMSSSKSHIFHLPNEPSKQCIKLPKGVLKIKTDCVSRADHNEGINHTSGLMPADQLGIQVSSLSPKASAPGVHGFAMDSGYYYHINTSRSTSGNSCSSPWKRMGALNTYPLLANSPLGVQDTVLEDLKRGNCSAMLGNFYQSATKHNLAYSDEAYGTREFPHEKNLLKNFGRHNAIIPESSPDPFTRSSDDYHMNGFTQIHNSKNAENVSEILTLGTSIRPPYKHLLQQSQIMGRYQEGLKFKTPGSKSVTEIEEEYRFPYTYNRRKLHMRHGLVDPAKKSTMVVPNSPTPSALASMENVKAKAIKL